MLIFALLAALSISILEMPACIEPALQKFFYSKIFMKQLGIVIARKPFRVPSFDHSEAKKSWMRFLTHQLLTPLTDFIQHDGDMTQAFPDAGGPALRPRHESLPHARFIHFDLLHIEAIHIDTLGIFRIGHCRVQSLGDNPCGAFGNKFENIERFLDPFTAYFVHHQPHFPRRKPDKFRDRLSFHRADKFRYFNFVLLASATNLTFGELKAQPVFERRAAGPGAGAAAPTVSLASPLRSPEWMKKVRVGENSPSLCPTMFSVTKTGINFRPL